MEAVLLCGIQASGKSTFYVTRFFDTHVRISQDLLRTRHRVSRLLELCLETGQPFVVDRVNATPADRSRFVAPAQQAGFRLVAYWFDTQPGDAISRNDHRLGRARVPIAAILGTYKQLVPPGPQEGFDEIFRVTADGVGGFRIEPASTAGSA
jgi:predicted kinase